MDAMPHPRIRSLIALAVFVALSFAAYEAETAAATGPPLPTGDQLRPVITTSELVVGHNRLAFGLLKHHRLIDGADVIVRVYEIDGQQAQPKAEARAPYHKLEVVEQGQRLHVHPDGTHHVHHEETDVRGLYVAQVTFERPGTWGLQLVAKQGDGTMASLPFTVNVLPAPHTPALGAAAPRSQNLIASDVSDLTQIDTSDPPDPRLHRVRIADAIIWGKPQVIVFATPKFCTTRLCGPLLDVVRMLLPAYGDQVVFTHQEIWQDPSAQKLFKTVEEWNLPSEPWVFVVDREGIIRAKFEGLVTAHELEAALKQILLP
jgi:hypothetical protein